MDNQEIGNKIKYARTMRHVTLDDVARKIGVAKSTVQRYEAGKIDKIKLPVIESIAYALNVNPAWLIGKSDNIDFPLRPTAQHGVPIKVLGRVAAGIPIEAIEDVIDTEEITEEMAKTGTFFGLQIRGDSMEPRIYDGDVVIVRQQEDAESGDIVIALVNGDDAVCKRLSKYDGGISLISLNSKYDPLIFTDKDVQNKPVRIIGKVVELRGKL